MLESYRQLVGILVTLWELGDTVEPYLFRALLPSVIKRFIRLREFICVVSYVRNCAAHNCTPAPTWAVYQERRITEHHRDKIQHRGNVLDLVVNLAQLHNADNLRPLYPEWTYPGLTRDEVMQRALTDAAEGDADNNEYESDNQHDIEGDGHVGAGHDNARTRGRTVTRRGRGARAGQPGRGNRTGRGSRSGRHGRGSRAV